MVRDTSAVKRSDLTLRCRYVGLETEIYQMDEYRFAIYCKNYRGSFEKLRAEFDHSIRQAGTWVELTQEIPGTYLGKLRRANLPKVYAQTASCCLDCSMSNQVNIRNALLLYSTIYLILPFADRFEAFLAEQNLSRAELLGLAEMGRVTFVVSNLESRYDQRFLLDAYQCNPFSIIGRRGINTVVAAFLSETREKFLTHFPNSADSAAMIRELAEQSGEPMLQAMGNMLAWPLVEPANSFIQLNSSGPISFGLMGLDRFLLPLLSRGDQRASDNLSLLLHFAGNTVFLASAFNATLFRSEFEQSVPFNQGLHVISSIISDILQLYWYEPEAIKDVQLMRGQSFDENQAISLFDCKENVSAVKVAELADKYQTYDGFKRIIDNLGRMDADARKRQITEYNDTLLDLASTPQRSSGLDFILSSSSFFPLPYALALILATMSLVKGKISASDFMQKQAELKRIEACLKATGRPQTPQFVEDIYTLDKISRVAGLR